MKLNHANLLNILNNSGNISTFSIAKFDWNSTYYFTDFGYDVAFDGNNYSSNNPIVSGGSVQYSTTVDREIFTMKLSGLDSAMVNEVEAGIIHMPVDLKMIFVVNGVPQTSINQILSYYTGKVLSATFSVEEEEKIIDIELSAPLSNLDETGTLYTTKDGMSVYDNTDTCFDQISRGSEEFTLKWGRV